MRSGSCALSMSDCLFRKTSPRATLYRGDRTKVISRKLILDGFEEDEAF